MCTANVSHQSAVHPCRQRLDPCAVLRSSWLLSARVNAPFSFLSAKGTAAGIKIIDLERFSLCVWIVPGLLTALRSPLWSDQVSSNHPSSLRSAVRGSGCVENNALQPECVSVRASGCTTDSGTAVVGYTSRRWRRARQRRVPPHPPPSSLLHNTHTHACSLTNTQLQLH